jgi:hypothetical protein
LSFGFTSTGETGAPPGLVVERGGRGALFGGAVAGLGGGVVATVVSGLGLVAQAVAVGASVGGEVEVAADTIADGAGTDEVPDAAAVGVRGMVRT